MFNKIKKIIEYGLYLIAFLLPIQTRLFLRLGETEYSTISLYGIDFLIVIILLVHCFIALRSLRSRINDLRISTIWWLIAGLDLFIFISIFFASDKILAIYHYGIFLLGVGLFWLVISAKYDRIKLIWSFVLGLSLQACLGIWQFVAQSSFASKWLGIAMHNSSDLGVSVIEILNGERWLRAYGGLDHPNVLGGAMAVGILGLIGLAIEETRNPSKGRTGKKQALSNFQFITLFTVYCLLFTVLLFSFSRAAWLAFVVGVVVLLTIYFIRKDYFQQKILLKFILLSAVLIFIFYNIYPNLFQTRIVGETRLENKSNQERIASLQESKEIIKDNLFFGTGIGNYTLVLREKFPNQEIWYYQPAHNTYLLVLSEIGVFGFLFLVSCFLYLVYRNCLGRNYVNIAIIISIATMMLFDHWWWSLHFGMLFFWFILALLYIRGKVS